MFPDCAWSERCAVNDYQFLRIVTRWLLSKLKSIPCAPPTSQTFQNFLQASHMSVDKKYLSCQSPGKCWQTVKKATERLGSVHAYYKQYFWNFPLIHTVAWYHIRSLLQGFPNFVDKIIPINPVLICRKALTFTVRSPDQQHLTPGSLMEMQTLSA